jgi:hypothetical protein
MLPNVMQIRNSMDLDSPFWDNSKADEVVLGPQHEGP